MVRSTCWLYSTLITNTTITITTITTKCSKCGGLPAWTPFYSNWHCANNSVCKTHFRVPACVFITYVYVFNMSNCERQDVNYDNQMLQAAGKWSPVSPQAQSRVHVSSVWLIRFLAFWFGVIEILWSTYGAQPPALPVASFLDWAHEPFGCTNLRCSMPKCFHYRQQWLKLLAISSQSSRGVVREIRNVFNETLV